MRGKWGEHIGVICWSHDLASHDSERIDNPGSGSSLCNKRIQFNKLICNSMKNHRYMYSPHSPDFTFSALPPQTNFSLNGQSQDSKRTVCLPQERQQGGSRSGRLSYGCIYKTHSFPIMLVSISMCVFSMILKYRTLYSKSKMSLNREKLLTNDVDMSTILLCNGEIITRSNCVRVVLQFIKLQL